MIEVHDVKQKQIIATFAPDMLGVLVAQITKRMAELLEASPYASDDVQTGCLYFVDMHGSNGRNAVGCFIGDEEDDETSGDLIYIITDVTQDQWAAHSPGAGDQTKH